MKWFALGESVAGTSHCARQTPCQDAFRIRTFGSNDEWLVVAVADGAGSAPLSEIGATLACEEFVRRVVALDPDGSLSREGMIALFADVRNALIAESERLDVRARELACTALLAIVGPTSAAVAQIGDGAIVLGDGQVHRAAFWPEPAEYANVTDFLTDDRFADYLRSETTTEPISEVAILTDGLQRLALVGHRD